MTFKEHLKEGVDMDSYPKRVTDINKMLKSKGHSKYKLARGKGYFYFYGGDAMDWVESGVYTYNINDRTLASWLETFLSMKENN